MYKYVTEDESRPELAATEVPSSDLSAEARQTIYKEAYEASLYQRNEKKNADQQALDWEIAQIQTDIEDQRKRWEAVYSSDEEGEAGGAETQAVVTDMKRREAVVAAVVEEVTKKEVITHRALAHEEAGGCGGRCSGRGDQERGDHSPCISSCGDGEPYTAWRKVEKAATDCSSKKEDGA